MEEDKAVMEGDKVMIGGDLHKGKACHMVSMLLVQLVEQQKIVIDISIGGI